MKPFKSIVMLLFYSFIMLLFQHTYAGHISSRDIKLVLNNRGNPGTFYFYFTLDTAISSSDYLRLVMPFQIGSISSGYWGIYSDCIDSTSVQNAAVLASTISGDTNAFFVQFFYDTAGSVPAPLSSSVEYFLRFVATPAAGATVGISSPVMIYTVSNNQGNWITYDFNPVFGLIYLADDYPKTMSVAISIDSSQTNSQKLGASYLANFDFTPTQTIANGARIYLATIDQSFSLTNCQSIANPTQGFYSFSSIVFENASPNTIRATISEAVKLQKYRFLCTVTNPSLAKTSGIVVRSWYRYQGTVVESGTSTLR